MINKTNELFHAVMESDEAMLIIEGSDPKESLTMNV